MNCFPTINCFPTKLLSCQTASIPKCFHTKLLSCWVWVGGALVVA
jgi:hypothetical protein